MALRKAINEETGELEERPSTLADAFNTAEIVPQERNAEQIQMSIVKRAMAAGSLDELFDVWDGKSSDALVGKTFEFIAVEWDIYTTAEGKELPLAQVSAVDMSDKSETDFITTSPNLTSFLRRAQQLDALPFTARIVDVPTRSGNKALKFQRV